MKDPLWQQGNPLDQLMAIRSGLEEACLSLEYGHISKSVFLSRAFDYLDQIRKLEPFLKGELSWDAQDLYVGE